MTAFDIFLQYFGGVTMAIIFLYGLRNYWITLFAGFVAFCVFYFSFGTKEIEWEIHSLLINIKDAAIIYSISFIIAVIIYKIIPLKQTAQVSTK
jgi:hypothetical protein